MRCIRRYLSRLRISRRTEVKRRANNRTNADAGKLGGATAASSLAPLVMQCVIQAYSYCEFFIHYKIPHDT
jgi:hypothetical protein